MRNTKQHTMSLRHCFTASLLHCMAAALALAAAPAAAQMSEVAALQGADREQRLIEGARKEGSLTLYTSFTTNDMAVFFAAFEKKYGIKVNAWRASSEAVLQRAVNEARARRYEVDAFETNGPELEALHREQILQAVNSPHHSTLVPQAVRPHREWATTRFNLFVAAYNTNLVKKEELPRTWADLAHPQWKGRLGIEAYDHDWFAGIVGGLGEAQGLKVFRDIVSANGISVRKGHTLLSNLVVSGEVPLALTIYYYRPVQLKEKGAPIDWFALKPVLARPNGVAVARRAPHPHAALLFYDFMLNEAQEIMTKRNFIPSSARITATLKDVPQFTVIDPKVVLDEGEKWVKLYDEIFIKHAR
ncbi:MAG: ABC transporter substrate-binding protein [Burkholderiales bacterium]